MKRRQRLTELQVAVQAAVERLGEPTLPELLVEFPERLPSEILRVLDSLEARGTIESSGNRAWSYLGRHAEEFNVPPEDVVRFRRRTPR